MMPPHRRRHIDGSRMTVHSLVSVVIAACAVLLLLCSMGVMARRCDNVGMVMSVNIETMDDCTEIIGDLTFAPDGVSASSQQIKSKLKHVTIVTGTIYYLGTFQSPLTFFELTGLVTAHAIKIQSIPDLTSINFPSLETVEGDFFIYGMSKVKSVQAPVLNTVGIFTLKQLEALMTAIFSELTTVTNNVVLSSIGKSSGTGITTILFPQLRTIATSLTVMNWPSLTVFQLPVVSIDQCQFQGLSALGIISMPNLVSTGMSIASSPLVSTLDMPRLTTATGSYGLGVAGTSLTTLELPSLTTVSHLMIVNNPLMETIGLGNLTTVTNELVISGAPLVRNLNSLLALRTVGSLVIKNNAALEDINGLFHVSPKSTELSIEITTNDKLRSVSGLCALRGAVGTLNVPHVSCLSLTDVFLGKTSPSWTMGKDCNDTNKFDPNQMCNCQSLISIQPQLCGRDDWACYNVTHAGDYYCHSIRCQPLVDTMNYTVVMSHDGVFPSTATYTCREGFSSVDPMERTCVFIDGSWTGNEPHCYDIDECLLSPPVCDPQSLCYNTIGSWECSPYPVDGSMYSGHNRAANITGGGVELLDNIGGQVVSFLMVRAKGDIPVTSIIWRSAMFTDMYCNSITRVNIPGTPHALMTCTMDEGNGRGYHVILQFDSHGRVGVSPQQGRDPVNYPHIAFVPNTLHLMPDGEPKSSLLLPSRDVYNVSFDVLHIGNKLPSLKQPWLVRYGPWWSPRQYICTVHTVTLTSLTCSTQQDAYGTVLRLILPWGEAADDAYSSDTLSYLASTAPRVLWIKGCRDVNNGTMDCPTQGGTSMQVLVDRRPKEPYQVLVSGTYCEPNGPITDLVLACTLPFGAGKHQPVVIVEAGSVGEPSKLLSYASPTIASIAGCEGHPVSGNPLQIKGCARRGGDLVTLMGTNFGQDGATIFVGSSPCTITTQHPGSSHTIAYCVVPPGVDTSVVLLLQDGGVVSTTSASIVHTPCKPGYETNYTATPTETDPACQSCTPGFYSTAGEVCHLCEPLTIAPNYGASNCSTCPAGFFERERKRCESCGPGEVAISGGCKPCEAGKYAAMSCEACPIGKYAAGAGSSRCTECEAGKFGDTPGRLQCNNCPSGRYHAGTNGTVCDVCSAGFVQPDEGKETCKPCQAGKFGDITGLQCFDCQPGRYQSRVNGTTCDQCADGSITQLPGGIDCSVCQPGEYEVAKTQCIWCEAGKYSDRAGVVECTPCRQGSYAQIPSQSTCTYCEAGRYSEGRGGTTCTKCSPGHYQRDTNGTMCSVCTSGTVQPDEGKADCKACTPGKYADVSGLQCNDCAMGRYQPGTGAAGCPQCDEGLVQPYDGKSSCQSCVPGKYADVNGIQCNDCQPGHAQPEYNRTTCDTCIGGTIQPDAGKAECKPCLPGEYELGHTQCVFCDTGKYQSQVGATECIDCAMGSYAQVRSSSICGFCEPGKYADATGSKECKNCPIGRYHVGTNGTSCEACRNGTVQPDEGKDTCKSCSPGTFADGIKCTDCPAGSYQLHAGSTMCDRCPTGTVQPDTGKASCRACDPGSMAASITIPCVACEAGKFQAHSFKTSCDECPIGMISGKGAHICDECPAGSMAAVGANQCVWCDAGKFQNDSSMSFCYDCAPGSISPKDATECTPCPAGSMRAPDANQCTWCDAGKYQTLASMSYCIDCEMGSIAPSKGSLLCTPCPAGTMAETNTSSTKCNACDAGKYQNGTSMTLCYDCATGSTSSKGATECQACPAGTMASQGNQCTWCDAGKYQSSTSMSYCIDCAPGTIASAKGSVQCTPCLSGTMADTNTSSTKCNACDAGKYQNGTSMTLCYDCDAGTTAPSKGSVQCTPCLAGTMADTSIKCSPCSAGRFSPANGLTACAQCSNGTFTKEEGSSKCEPCQPGWHSSAGTVCVACPQGTFSTNNRNGTDGCAPCPLGTYNPNNGQSMCLTCELGTWSKGGQNQCNGCSNGYSLEPWVTTCLPCREGLQCVDGVAKVQNDHWPWFVYQPHQLPNGSWTLRTEYRVQHCSQQRCKQPVSNDGSDDSSNLLALTATNKTMHYCAANRDQSPTNVLCAACAKDYSEWGVQSSCIECREANGTYIMLLVLMSFVVVYVLHTLAQNTSGLPSIFFYFVQISIAMAPASYVHSVLSLFNMSVSSTGLCIMPLTAVSQIVLSVMMPVWLLTVLGVIALFQALAQRVSCLRSCVHRLLWDWPSYQRTMIEMYMFSYSTVATTLVSYMVCTEAADHMVIFDYPQVSCSDSNYRTGLVVIVILFIAIVVLLPCVSLWFLYRRRGRLATYRPRCGTMFEAYRESKYFWQSVVVLRRSAFIALNLSLATRPAWRYLSFACLHGMSLVVHIFIRPYAHDILNRFESLTFITLAIIAIVMNAFPDPERSDDPKYGIDQTVLTAIITTLIMIPITVFFMYAATKAYRRWCRNDGSDDDALLAGSRDVLAAGADVNKNKYYSVGRDRRGISVNNPRDPLVSMKSMAHDDI